MKSYIAHVSSRRLFRALNIESNLARPVIFSNSNSVSWEIYSWAAIEAHQAIFIPSKFSLCAKYSHIVDFLWSRWMETAPTSIEVLLRPTLGQSDEPSDLRGSLSPTSVYSSWQSPGGHPSNYEPGATLLNFSDKANHDDRTPYSVLLELLLFFYFPKLNLCNITLVTDMCFGSTLRTGLVVLLWSFSNEQNNNDSH